MSRNKIKKEYIVLLFAITYVICPHYFRVFGVAVRDMILCGCFALMIAIYPHFTFSMKYKNITLFYGLGIWTFVIAMIQIYHGDYFDALKHLILWLGVPFFAIKIINTKEKFISVIDALIYVAIGVGLLGVVEEVFRFDIFTVLNTIGAKINYNPMRLGILRILSFTSHTITYCCYCMFLLGLIFYCYQIKKRKIYVFAYVLMLLNAFFTLSRSALVGLIVSQLLLMWLCGYRNFIKKAVPVAVLLVVAVLVLGTGIPTVFNMIKTVCYMILAIFDESYVPLLHQMGFTDNAGGIGNRFDLYYWVYRSLNDNYLLGNGTWASFAYTFLNDQGYLQTKISIEVEWLDTLYRYGFIGMFAEIYYYVTYIHSAFLMRYKRPQEWEGKISFPRVVGAMTLCYVLVLFAVMQNEEMQLLAVILILFLAYVSHDGYVSDRKKIV